uniref:Uncharacterized protein n=1 Tax=Anguilla anguilla TaxID=7936 RepID=A0A0E9VVL1_ANGAN
MDFSSSTHLVEIYTYLQYTLTSHGVKAEYVGKFENGLLLVAPEICGKVLLSSSKLKLSH